MFLNKTKKYIMVEKRQNAILVSIKSLENVYNRSIGNKGAVNVECKRVV